MLLFGLEKQAASEEQETGRTSTLPSDEHTG